MSSGSSRARYVPVGVLALAAGARLLPAATEQRQATRLDLRGMTLAGIGMCLLVFPLVQGHQRSRAARRCWARSAVQRLGRRVLHAGLLLESTGLLMLYAVLRHTGTGVGSLDLLVPMIVGGMGMGMGMIFVPLFDIVMAGVEPHEMGSASGVLQATNGLAMSLA
jgi:hypothetical protein